MMNLMLLWSFVEVLEIPGSVLELSEGRFRLMMFVELEGSILIKIHRDGKVMNGLEVLQSCQFFSVVVEVRRFLFPGA